MLISYKYKFIFIHNYKVAGSSISLALKDFALQNPTTNNTLNTLIEQQSILGYFLNKIANKRSIFPSFNSHDKAFEIKQKLPRNIWNDFFKFGFVRNPWDWQVSLYHFMLQDKNHFQHRLIKKMKSFEEYIEWRVNEDKHLQKEFFTDEKDNLIVDYIGKLEYLGRDFHDVCKKIHIPPKIKLPHINKSKHKSYRGYYNDYTRELIAKHFKEDIELFNYKF